MHRTLAVALAAVLALAPTVRAQVDDDDDRVKARAGKFVIEESGTQTRLVYDGTLIGTQYHETTLHRADIPNMLGLGTQWEALALVGLHSRWNATHEPLTYYHRTGPVGAMFYHLRTRKGGADAAAPVGVAGIYAGTPAAYSVRGQRFTFYSIHPESRTLIENTDRYFTYLSDARKRGALVECKYGPLRKTLAADTDKRFALLLVEMVEDGFDPKDRLTLEAVRLYMERVTADGIVALHISNKKYLLEPVVERIARELGLAARLWADDSESRPGKTSSSWVVLARTPAALGILARPASDQVMAFGTRNRPLAELLVKYRPHRPAREVFEEEWGIPTSGPGAVSMTVVSCRQGPQVAQLYQYVERARESGDDITLVRLSDRIHGPMFQQLGSDPRVELRTDDHRPGLPVYTPAPPKK